MSALSVREREVVVLLARGLTYSQAAIELGLSPRTVKWHAGRIRAKLGVSRSRQIPEAYMRETGEDPFPRAAA